MHSHHPPTVIITGAATGIGRTAALDFDQRGWRVFAGVLTQAEADDLKAAAPERLIPLILDITNGDQIAAAVQQVTETINSSGLTGLINNAGIAVAAPLEYIDLDLFRRSLEVNVTGQVAMTQAFLPLIRQSKGRVVFTGSIGGRSAFPFFSAYTAAKFGLEGVVDSLRLELRPHGVHVALITPGATRTPIWEQSLAKIQQWVDAQPAEIHMLYGAAMERARIRGLQAGTTGNDPQHVADAMRHALTSPRPHARYLVGGDAHLRLWLERLPWRWRDWVVDRVIFKNGNDA